MKYVYIISSLTHPEQRYFGITSDLRQRLSDHNNGMSVHTSKFRPWQIETYVAFSETRKAMEFETYLKTGSGKAFSKKRL